MCCVFWWWAESSQLSNLAEVCVTELQLYTFIILSTRKVSHLKIPVWAAVYKMITEISQIWRDRNQTFSTIPSCGSMTFAKNHICCTSHTKNIVIRYILNWLQCMWEGTDAQLMYRGDEPRAEYRTLQKCRKNVFCIQLDVNENYLILFHSFEIKWKMDNVFNICESKESSWNNSTYDVHCTADWWWPNKFDETCRNIGKWPCSICVFSKKKFSIYMVHL